MSRQAEQGRRPDEAPGVFHKIEGDGPVALVLVHGAMCDHRNWDRMVPHLSGEFTVARLDLAGHGKSPAAPEDCSMDRWAADVNALAASFGFARTLLVGHSLGGRVVAHAAAAAPQPLAGVVLLDGSRMDYPDLTEPPGWQPEQRTRVDFDELIGPYATPEVRTEIRSGMDRRSRPVFAAIGEELQAWDTLHAERAYGALAGRTPLLAVQSTYHDRYTRRYSLTDPQEDTRYLANLRRLVPQLETRILTGAGHFPMMERPAEVAEAIARFARSAIAR